MLRGLCLAGMALVMAAGCEPASPESEQDEPDGRVGVQVATVERVTAGGSSRHAGVLRARQRARPAFLHAGTLSTRAAEIGDAVAAGDPLAELHNPALAPAVAVARGRVAELDERIAQLERDLSRARALRERDLNADETVDQLESELAATRQAREQARAQLDEAREQYEERILRAPFDGRVVDVLAEPGDFVAAGQPILALSGDDGLEVALHLPSSSPTRPEAGTRVTLTRPLDGGRFEGRLTRVGAGGTGPAPAIVRVDAAEGLAPGQPVHVHLPRPATDTLRIPLAAVVDPGGDAPHVFRLDDDTDTHRVSRVPITAGRLQGREIEITSGLSAGDRVVVAGQGRLSDGQAVRVVP